MGEIGGDGDGGGGPLGDELGEIARAAGEIEDDGALRHGGHRDALALPAAIHSIGKNARDEIVLRRDDPEHMAHEPGIRPFGRDGHFPGIVAQWGNRLQAAPKLHQLEWGWI